MPFEVKYPHEALLKDKNINEADLPESIRAAIESFNAVKATVSKKSNEVRRELIKELKFQSGEIAQTIKDWEADPSIFSIDAPDDSISGQQAPPAPTPAPAGSPSPSMEAGGSTPPAPAAQPAIHTPNAEPKKKSGGLITGALWGLFAILVFTVGPEMIQNTREWVKSRKK